MIFRFAVVPCSLCSRVWIPPPHHLRGSTRAFYAPFYHTQLRVSQAIQNTKINKCQIVFPTSLRMLRYGTANRYGRCKRCPIINPTGDVPPQCKANQRGYYFHLTYKIDTGNYKQPLHQTQLSLGPSLVSCGSAGWYRTDFVR